MGGALSGLTPQARTTLLVMALNAHDTGTKTDPARTYFRGWEHIAQVALGRDVYDRPAKQAVERVIRELQEAGWIKQTGRRHGTRHGLSMYELHI